MAKYIIFISLLFINLFTLSDKAVAQTSNIIINHTNTNADIIPQYWLDQARQLTQFFNHKSIGGNILDGMRNLQMLNPTKFNVNINYSNGTNVGINEYQSGSNTHPLTKISGFTPLVKNGHDLAMMKFCLADAPCVTGDTEMTTIWNNYRTAMEQLENNTGLSNTKLVYWTFPVIAPNNSLNSCNQEIQEKFNNLIRQYIANSPNTGKILFDLADIESHDTANPVNHITWNSYDAAVPSYTSDGGHLCTSADVTSGVCSTNTGSLQVAKAWWWMMARVAGWNGTTLTPSPTMPYISVLPTQTPTQLPTPTQNLNLSPTPKPNYLPGDINSDSIVDIFDFMILSNNFGTNYTAADLNKDNIVNILDFIILSENFGNFITIPTNPIKPTIASSPTPSPVQTGNKKWGGFYVPAESLTQYGMTANITGQLTSPTAIMNALAEAKSRGFGLIVTAGTVSECTYPIDGTQSSYNTALNYFNNIFNFTPSQLNQLQSYANDGTLLAFRVYDEIHDASCGGIPTSLQRCMEDGSIDDSTVNISPVGSAGAPGYGDLLFELSKKIPSNARIGSTSAPSYMVKVIQRINDLRVANGMQPLSPNSILAYGGPPGRLAGQPVSQTSNVMNCMVNTLDSAGTLYFLGNRSAADGGDNYDFFEEFMAICQTPNVDVTASWSWGDGNPTFSSRMADLADGGVSSGGKTITLMDLQNNCK